MKPGEFIRTRQALLGVAQGPSAEHGDGAPCEIPAGSLCEIYDVQPTLGWLTLHFELLDSGPRQPYRCEAIATAQQVQPASRPRLPPLMPEGGPDDRG
jgi:hypothetical protein